MAKSKNSKILAMALCASVMAGIYASPVMAADIKVEKGSTLKGVTPSTSTSTDYTITSGTLKLDGADIVNALNGKNINLGTGSLIINDKNIGNSVAAIRRVVNKDTGMSATYLEETVKAHSAFGLQVLDKDGKAVATISRNGTGEFNGPLTANKSLTALDVVSKAKSVLGVSGVQLYNSDGTNKVNITNSGASRFGSFDETNVRIEGGALKIMAANNAAVSGPLVAQLSEDGLTLVDANREYSTLTAAQLANLNSTIKAGGVVDAKELNVEGIYGGFHVKDVSNNGKNNTMIYTTDQNDKETLFIDTQNGNLVSQGSLNVAGGRFIVDKDTGNMAVNAADDKAVFQVNGNDGTVHVGKVGGAQTVITGNSITTETLNVENIKLGNSMTDKNGNTITVGAAGVIDIEKDGNTVFRADTDNFEAHYDNYDLTLDGTNGFALSLSNVSNTSSFSLDNDGFAFAGPVNLGDGTQVKFSHNKTDISLSSLVNRVENLEQKTTGISFDENTGNTTIKDMNKGTDGKWTAGDSSVTVGDNGTTFENGEGNGATNINGGAIDADSSSIGDNVNGGSGSGSSGMDGNGTYTDGSEHSGHFVDKDSSYKFTNDANGFTGTVTDGKHTTTIENGAMGSNTTVEGDNASASSGVGIGNDGAFISDSVTNGDMTVTEVKDKNGSATTVKDANGSSTVSQDTKGQTVSTGTGTSVNTGNDFGVTDNETGKSIYMSDIGHVEDIDSEIQNSDGSKTTVVDAVNNEAEIRRNEIERVDGRINNLENRVGKLEDRIDKVGAMAAAIANLRTMGYDPAAPTEVAVGIGQYRDETGAALGLFHYPNRDFMLSLSVSTSGDEVMGGIGATWKFGRKSPEKVAEIKKAQAEADARRAEEAKLAKAEEMKQAAKEAKIKAQQERHAKLAAERAAQAEAAK